MCSLSLSSTCMATEGLRWGRGGRACDPADCLPGLVTSVSGPFCPQAPSLKDWGRGKAFKTTLANGRCPVKAAERGTPQHGNHSAQPGTCSREVRPSGGGHVRPAGQANRRARFEGTPMRDAVAPTPRGIRALLLWEQHPSPTPITL